MKVFSVQFLALLYTIGNQGDPIQADDVPSYLVSVRNVSDCHICAGSMLSTKWVITSRPGCEMATHIIPGLTKLTRCNAPEEGKYHNNIENSGTPECDATSGFYLYKVKKFHSKPKTLGLPQTPPIPPNKTGTVIGWSFENNEFEFTQINHVNITKAVLSVNDTFKAQFRKLSLGSPLIDDGRIYGFYINNSTAFENIRLRREWIKEKIKK